MGGGGGGRVMGQSQLGHDMIKDYSATLTQDLHQDEDYVSEPVRVLFTLSHHEEYPSWSESLNGIF